MRRVGEIQRLGAFQGLNEIALCEDQTRMKHEWHAFGVASLLARWAEAASVLGWLDTFVAR